MAKDIQAKISHLGLIQGVIERMGRNSFIIKIQAIVFASGSLFFIASSFGDINPLIGLLILVWLVLSILLFLFLDAYYLSEEKLFRDLYDKVRGFDNEPIDFSMKVKRPTTFGERLKKRIDASKSTSIWPFYFYLLISVITFVGISIFL